MLLSAAGHTIEAISVGGMETCIALPEWKLCFDIGRCPPFAHRAATVLFTHPHLDHLGAIANHCATRDMLGMPPPHYVVPAECFEDVLALLDVWRRLDRSPLTCRVTPAAPGDRIPLGPGKFARAFRAVHRVPTLGYALYSQKKRLKPEYVDTPGKELARMRAEGVEFEDVAETAEVAFCGDTTIDVFDREEVVRKCRALVLEVTFLDGGVPVDSARRKGHVHLDEVVERAELFENEAIVFTHFSTRYGPDEIQRILSERLPAVLKDRVTALLPEPPWYAPKT